MKKQLSIVLFLFAIICEAQLNPQTKKITEKYFPDPEVEINTPAFAKKKGFTTYDEMMAYLNELQANHSAEMSISFIGQSQKGKDIPLVLLKRKGGDENKLKVWIQGGLHGNEPASTEGVLYLLSKLLDSPDCQYLLDKLEIAVVPMANIDGFEKQSRYAANGLDLNRDQTKLMAQESVALKKAFSDFSASVGLDFHEYRPYRRDFTQLSNYGVTNGYDVMFLYSGNLNVPKELRLFTKATFVDPATKVLDQNSLTHHDYFTESKVMGAIQFTQGSTNSRSSATSYALTNAVSSLIEIRGVGIGKTSFKRRVYSTFLVAESYLKSAYENKEAVEQVVASAVKTKDEAVVKSEREKTLRKLTMIDIETNDKIEIEASVKDAWNSTAVLSRARPNAYLILPEQKAVIDRLKTLGLKVETLQKQHTIEVEVYSVIEYQKDAEKYEGVNKQEVQTEITVASKTFPEGTCIVYLNQPKANLAIEVLEPEAPNSFVSFDVLETALGMELPIYRYMKTETL